jgi:O-6-methylguanine DNA methyltransferase
MTSAGSGRFQLRITHPLTDLTVHARIVQRSIVITGISFGKPGGRVCGLAQDRRLNDIARVLRSILDGCEADTAEWSLDYSWCTPFQKKVMTAARKIPWGTTISYAQLAHMAGYPRAVRAAASVMRNNRVVRSNGTIGGFMGKNSGRAIALKRRLLENEQKAACHRQVRGRTPADR